MASPVPIPLPPLNVSGPALNAAVSAAESTEGVDIAAAATEGTAAAAEAGTVGTEAGAETIAGSIAAAGGDAATSTGWTGYGLAVAGAIETVAALTEILALILKNEHCNVSILNQTAYDLINNPDPAMEQIYKEAFGKAADVGVLALLLSSALIIGVSTHSLLRRSMPRGGIVSMSEMGLP